MKNNEHILSELQAQQLKRSLKAIDSRKSSQLELANGQTLHNFASNDYLGLSQHPLLLESFKRAIDTYGAGSGSSRLLAGSFSPQHDLEDKLAELKHQQACLSFSSGYATAVGIIPALCDKDDMIIFDKLCHASLIDGIKLSGAKFKSYKHQNLDQLASYLKQASQDRKPNSRLLIITESVFSMDGDLSDLATIAQLKEEYQAELMLDEAHSIGLFGTTGMGLAHELNLCSAIDYHVGTLSKSIGLSGGYLTCSQVTKELLINKARSFIYSTAPPPAIAQAAQTSLNIITGTLGKQLREDLWSNINYLNEKLNSLNSESNSVSKSAIIPFFTKNGSAKQALAWQQQLEQQGFWVPAIRYPTVAKNQSRLRISLTSQHKKQTLDALIDVLSSLETANLN